ncbi:hypothetical protein CHARACLAT_031209 [Characodon lateralis]|uniref:Secreted protein n=1 Tax=Characodon lateralis TaxID=208331 RepID=A0ABU7CSU2_9TELE|nr:hypothetical protein [Characodon lateralis]
MFFFLWPFFHKVQLYIQHTAYCGPIDRYSSLCCGTLQPLQDDLWSLCCPQINVLLAWSVRSGGQPSLDRSVVVPCVFHVKMKDLIVFWGNFKDLNTFYNPTLTCTSQQLCH